MIPEFKDCLKKQKLKIFSRGKALVSKELKTAEEDLKTAKVSFKNENYKWATIQCYYSMFHSARALLYSKNYRERSHYCLIVALRVFYGEKGLLSSDLIEGLQRAKTLRENADYYDQWSKPAAEALLNSASKFLVISTKLLKSVPA
ncbi:MAG: HEPN domain-containing protein [Candidatus Aminicenantes bacterium]|nr:HEPN domain-containing protein [Candidatus Aminicenantes bacterium]